MLSASSRKDTALRSLIILTLLFSISPLVFAARQTPSDKAAEQHGKDAPSKPGKDRWLVKTASDPGAGAVNRRPEKTTVEKLRAIPRPADFPPGFTPDRYQTQRAGAVEKTIYTVEADVVECRLMPDGDYHVVIRGASGETMVLEMPDPSPAFTNPNSPFAYAIRAARERFEAKVKPERAATPLNLHARITGIGFFGRQYAKQPAKGNLIQLHPVVDFDWQEKPSTEFASDRRKSEQSTAAAKRAQP